VVRRFSHSIKLWVARPTGPSTSNSSASANPIPEGCQWETEREANQSPTGLRWRDRVRSGFTNEMEVRSPLDEIPLPQSASGPILWNGEGSSASTIGYNVRNHNVVGPPAAIQLPSPYLHSTEELNHSSSCRPPETGNGPGTLTESEGRGSIAAVSTSTPSRTRMCIPYARAYIRSSSWISASV
jgi:hypothetical protein